MADKRTYAIPLVIACILLAFVAGFLVGDGMASPPADPWADEETRPHSLSMAGPGCLDPDPNESTGWLHVVADGTLYDVTMAAHVAHDPDERVDVTVREGIAGAYVVDLETVVTTEDAEKPTPPDRDDCTVGSELTLGTNVPTDFERIEVRMNGRTVEAFEKEGTVPTLHRLPTPIEA